MLLKLKRKKKSTIKKSIISIICKMKIGVGWGSEVEETQMELKKRKPKIHDRDINISMW